jgi:hypothetical protein
LNPALLDTTTPSYWHLLIATPKLLGPFFLKKGHRKKVDRERIYLSNFIAICTVFNKIHIFHLKIKKDVAGWN